MHRICVCVDSTKVFHAESALKLCRNIRDFKLKLHRHQSNLCISVWLIHHHKAADRAGFQE